MSDFLPPIITAESVTAGHPDKLCDSISDAILDACLTIDPEARVAVETLVKGMSGEAAIVLAGEVSLNGRTPDYEAIARQTAASIGYTDHSIGMDATSRTRCKVRVHQPRRGWRHGLPRSRGSGDNVRICLQRD